MYQHTFRCAAPEDRTRGGEGQLPSVAPAHHLAQPAGPLARGLVPARLRDAPSASSRQLNLPGTKPVFHHLRRLLGRQGNVLGGQSICQHFLCLPGHRPSHALRLKQNVTQLPLRSSLSSAPATFQLGDLGHTEDEKIACFLGCHKDQMRPCQ